MLVYNECDEIVLCRQNYLSDKYMSFTSGYISPGETAEETALREVKEELGIVWSDTNWFDVEKIDNSLTEPADTYIIANKLRWRTINE